MSKLNVFLVLDNFMIKAVNLKMPPLFDKGIESSTCDFAVCTAFDKQVTTDLMNGSPHDNCNRSPNTSP